MAGIRRRGGCGRPCLSFRHFTKGCAMKVLRLRFSQDNKGFRATASLCALRRFYAFNPRVSNIQRPVFMFCHSSFENSHTWSAEWKCIRDEAGGRSSRFMDAMHASRGLGRGYPTRGVTIVEPLRAVKTMGIMNRKSK